MSPPMLQLLFHYLRLLAELFGKKAPQPDEDTLDPHDPVAHGEMPQLVLPLPAPLAAIGDTVTVATPKPAALASAVIDDEGLLVGPGVVQVPSKRSSRQLAGKPVILLWHWTSTSHGTALTMAKRIQPLAQAAQRSGSVHFWIDGDGTIYQSVSCNRSTWHAGSPTSARFKKGLDGRFVVDPTRASRLSVNPLSIGVELVNVGEVRLVKPGGPLGSWVPARAGDPKAVFMGWPYGRLDKKTGKPDKGPVVKDDQVREALDRSGRRRLYHAYTQAQIDAAERLTRAVVDEYGLDRAACSWGHIDVDPTRKSDPGPLWYDLINPALLDRVFGT